MKVVLCVGNPSKIVLAQNLVLDHLLPAASKKSGYHFPDLELMTITMSVGKQTWARAEYPSNEAKLFVALYDASPHLHQ